MLLGPTSQLTIVPDGEGDVGLPAAADVVADLRRRTLALEPAQGPGPGGDVVEFPDFGAYP